MKKTAILMLLFLQTSCLTQRKTDEEFRKRITDLESRLASLQERPAKDNWQRSKECAEQADRLAKRLDWVEGKRDDNITLMGWKNHYSPKYQRCYIEVRYMNHEAKKNQLPLMYYILWDAFEGKDLAICNDSQRGNESSPWCDTEGSDPGETCRECRDFVRDRMNN